MARRPASPFSLPHTFLVILISFQFSRSDGPWLAESVFARDINYLSLPYLSHPMKLFYLCAITYGKMYFLIHFTPFRMREGTPAGKIPLGSPRCRWEDNIRMDHKELSINTKNWVDSAQGRDYWRTLVNTALNLRIS